MPPKNPENTIASKNIVQAKELFDQQHPKRKRIQIQPQIYDVPRGVGRPSRFDTLSKLANESCGKSKIYSQDFILLALDGTEKKRKTVLTKSTTTITCSSTNDYVMYEYITDCRRKALDIIKEQKEKLEKINILEKRLMDFDSDYEPNTK
ncbi:Hypothetical predicted protein [Paramuricea clavata]|uniref:Uncharacterized protein n=1 Tax=Paramuricea clavata TaxID=317549 RepID=A0A7D9DYS9_PARCT|nr:Hypothetical predicted protein [Paramuricea clavata]